MKKCLNIILALVLFFSAAQPAFAAAERRGIDVSQWQGSIDYRQVKDAGIRIVYIKAGEGADSIDPDFERNYQSAKRNRLHVGLYHYVTARTISEGRRQAHFFASLINEKECTCRPVMDFEQVAGLTKAQANRIALAYLRELQNLTGYRPVVYSDAYDAQTLWSKSVARYPLWIADYGESTPSSLGNWNRWEGFQYSDKGRIPGISGMVDLDRFRDGMYLNLSERCQKRPRTHHVKKGETLQRIAKIHRTTVLRIVELNRIDYPFSIRNGDTLIIKK